MNIIKFIDEYKIIPITLRLLLSLILGGLIGLEREDKNRPAGFKTHILVCVGSALVMLTSQFTFNNYKGLTNLDPARLGAQVISGIGFLGAGTIIQQGGNVKGLTTAATLWAVACIGLAVGIGFYEGAIVGSVLIYFTLVVLSRIEGTFKDKSASMKVFIDLPYKSEILEEVNGTLYSLNIYIRNVEIVAKDDSNHICMILSLKLPRGMTHDRVIEQLTKIEEIEILETV